VKTSRSADGATRILSHDQVRFAPLRSWRSPRTAVSYPVAIGGLASVLGAWWFSQQLPKVRAEARQLIMAQSIAPGEPAEEMTTHVIEVEDD